MKTIVISGGSGYLGKILCEHFNSKGWKVVILSRSNPNFKLDYSWEPWDGETLDSWTTCLERCEVLINLAGKSVNCRYTLKNKKLLIDSRIKSTEILNEAIKQVTSPPKLWMNASSATIHSNNGVISGENAPYGKGFSPELCIAWEKSLFKESPAPVRKIALRMGLVLDSSGSIMSYFKNLVRFGLGGSMGSGKQHISWLHRDDLIRIVDHLIIHDDLSGPINTVSPTPTQNQDFMKAFRKALNMPVGIPATSWMIKIGTFLLGTESELVLWDRQVIPKKLLDSGFQFGFPTIDLALEDLLRS